MLWSVEQSRRIHEVIFWIAEHLFFDNSTTYGIVKNTRISEWNAGIGGRAIGNPQQPADFSKVRSRKR